MSRTFIDFSLLSRATDEVKTIKAGEVVFREGDSASEFYVIRSGKVTIQLGNRTLQDLEEGEIFGEMALIDNAPRSATAIAHTDVELVPVGEKQFLFMTSEAPYFALSLMRVLVQRLRTANAAMPA